MSTPNDGFRRLLVKLDQKRDQSIATVRDQYMRLSPLSRQMFRDWVERHTFAGSEPAGVGMNFTLTVNISATSENGEEERVEVSLFTLLEAIKAWDGGGEYIHTKAKF